VYISPRSSTPKSTKPPAEHHSQDLFASHVLHYVATLHLGPSLNSVASNNIRKQFGPRPGLGTNPGYPTTTLWSWHDISCRNPSLCTVVLILQERSQAPSLSDCLSKNAALSVQTGPHSFSGHCKMGSWLRSWLLCKFGAALGVAGLSCMCFVRD